ncbi:hypothetical protein GobsT_04120 [Gemmata obscuriglobus]|uniref:DUF1501 domain-containing protein n=1 Tax=Gemmata obscuriglobus TaxID=114 RepID=A0A2Z3HDF2_9BACT|nr:DUF1501 domain-containing protein [Gemmata obscuriglobus]AWM40995.1 DUF1501 domain-containing protein [Gemmata obscuriglobus]QEG25685.1 hypothetical protein GobsT_04120 [Gemmata obscuriglobus]VTR99328.1 sulfatase : Uncharacterized protein OS=Pirellula staleyi (strain ATCC 27377 / DSM 6068 / ICPB 4128) GN=Psta_3359 PE=4 SV=1: DUF1501 [Gemmata obscuriglobus UQM 2246]
MNADLLAAIRLHQRRTFLTQSCRGVGALALSSLLPQAVAGATPPPRGVVTKPHVPPKAKRVIFMVMAGGASHLELFDHKPELAKRHGQPMPESVTKGQPIAQLQGAKLTCFGPQWGFKKHGQSGQEMNELFKFLPEVADDLCVVRSCKTEAINHDPAHTFMNSGSSVSGRPSMGSWLTYGIGSESADLPGFVVMTSNGRGGQNQPIASRQWSAGFLPGKFQGVQLRGKGDPVLYLTNPPGVGAEQQKDVIDAVARLNQMQNAAVDDPEIATRIGQYELAFRMQTSVPELMDLSKEPAKVLESYGTKGADGSFAANCLLARRMAQKGVRFIQLYHRDWDHHGGVKDGIKLKIEEIDAPLAALIKDLKRLGMFEDTLIVLTGEFGRTPMSQGGNGRDHHMKGFSVLLAGGGIKGGVSYGATDEFGYNAEEKVFPVHDLHATMLHLLGIDHERLTYKFQGRDYRLTDVHGRVVKEILA